MCFVISVFNCILHVTSSLYSNSTDPVHVNKLKGQPVTLKPEVPNVHMRFAQWSLNDTVIADWDEDDMSSNTLSNSMVLDNGTFSLTISPLMPNHTGLYTFKVNHDLTSPSFYLQVKGR